MVIYFLSSDFDYSRLISTGVSGPSVPQGFGWNVDVLPNLDQYPGRVALIDNRISEREIEWLEKKLSEADNTFAFFAVDPGREAGKKKYYFQFLLRIAERENVFIISRYQPREIALDLLQITGEARFHVLPYPYLPEREISRAFGLRKHRVAASGAVNEQIYPLRHRFAKKAGRFPLCLFADVLPHPGYPDVGQDLQHATVREAYTGFLSNYKFMFLSPSRFDLEFAKYAECAYAGCVPLGKPASSMTGPMKEAFLGIDQNRITASAIRNMFRYNDRELQERAAQYRQAFRKDRDPALLNKSLAEFFSAYAQ